MFASNPDSTLCPHHELQQRKAERREQEAAANELLAGIEDFSTADSVNLFLGNLVKQLTHKRISRLDAIALAYLSQLLLNSLTAVERESAAAKDAAERQEMLDAMFRRQRAAASARQSSVPVDPAGRTGPVA